jgi:hypothetical protein
MSETGERSVFLLLILLWPLDLVANLRCFRETLVARHFIGNLALVEGCEALLLNRGLTSTPGNRR